MEELQNQNERQMDEENELAQIYPWIRKVPPNLKPLLNTLIGNLSNFYQSLSKKGYYLPERGMRAIHGEYLWKVFTE